MKVDESTRYSGFIPNKSAPNNATSQVAPISRNRPYAVKTPIRPSTRVETLRAVNENPYGKQKSAPQNICPSKFAPVQSGSRIDPVSRKDFTAPPYAQSSLRGK